MCGHAGLRAAVMNGAHTNSFNGITGNSVLPQCFNAPQNTLTQEEIRNQYPKGCLKRQEESDHKDREIMSAYTQIINWFASDFIVIHELAF